MQSLERGRKVTVGPDNGLAFGDIERTKRKEEKKIDNYIWIALEKHFLSSNETAAVYNYHQVC